MDSMRAPARGRMHRGGAGETMQQHINATFVSWLATPPTSHTCVRNKEAAPQDVMTIVAVAVDAALEQDVVVAAAVHLAVAGVSVAAHDHARGAISSIVVVGRARHYHHAVMSLCMELVVTYRQFDVMVRHLGASRGEHRPRIHPHLQGPRYSPSCRRDP